MPLKLALRLTSLANAPGLWQTVHSRLSRRRMTYATDGFICRPAVQLFRTVIPVLDEIARGADADGVVRQVKHIYGCGRCRLVFKSHTGAL